MNNTLKPDASAIVVYELIAAIKKIVSRMPIEQQQHAYQNLVSEFRLMPSQQARDEIFSILGLTLPSCVAGLVEDQQPVKTELPDFQSLKAELEKYGCKLIRVFNQSTEVAHFEVHHGSKKRWFRDLESVLIHLQSLGVAYGNK